MTVKIGAIFRSSQKHVNSGGLKALVGKSILEILLGLSKTFLILIAGRMPFILITDYGCPMRKSPSLHG